jgi:hypothetical protein
MVIVAVFDCWAGRADSGRVGRSFVSRWVIGVPCHSSRPKLCAHVHAERVSLVISRIILLGPSCTPATPALVLPYS